ncbi:MAG: alpha/beta fold hydrolase [Coriobacteriales bacterium]|nr:alpha/beta fold hydrolase [Coriobacteriales bacterium]
MIETAATQPATAPRDLELSVRYDEGDGPPIVYLHGINSDASDWRVVIDTIGPGYRHIAPDLLGFGESPKPLDLEYTADDHTQAVDAMIERLGIDEPFLLVGYSLGGDIAIRYAATYPEKLRRLFLLSAPFYLPPEVFAAQGFGTQYLQLLFFKWAWRFVAGAKAKDDLVYQLASGRLQDAMKQFLRTDDVPTHWDIMSANLVNCIGKATFVDDLPKLDMPVTFALGIRDVIVHPDQTPALKALMPDMEIRRIVGLNADHFMLVSLPEKVAEEILRDEIGSLNVVAHERRASAEPPIVLLHSLATTGADLKPLASSLGTSHEVAVLDLLGFGGSLQSQTLRYTLEDHAVAIRNTLTKLFGQRPVRLVGEGLGANVALAVAAKWPTMVESVVAYSPPLFASERDALGDARTSAELAEVLAAREQLREVARNPEAQAIAGDKMLQRILPAVRSLDNAILAVDGPDLLARQKRPVRLVVPTGDQRSNPEMLHAASQGNDALTFVRPQGTSDDVLAHDPLAAAAEIVPGDSAVAAAAHAVRRQVKRRESRRGKTPIVDAARSVDNQLVIRGLLEIAAGLALLLMRNQLANRELLTLAFAAWVTWEGVFTIVGSFGLRREKKGWIVYFLLGALALAVGAFLLTNRDLTTEIVGWVIALRALYVGAANIAVARRVGEEAPKPKWLLYLQGILGVTIGLAIVFVPQLGGPLLRVTLAVYFLASGVLLVGQAAVAKRRTAREIRRLSFER